MISNRSFMYISLVALVVISLAVAAPASAQRRAASQVGANCDGGVGALFDEIEAAESLSGEEEADVLYLREEEKLARDVYLTLAERWQLPIFANIARAEQKHMDLVFKLIETYGLVDPITDDTIGVFSDGFLAQLYGDLVAAGEVSLVEALLVGATIEDMDLYDLYQMLENTDKDHIKLVVYNLAKGSRNHLRAFVRALEAQGETYTPLDYLDQVTFDAILAAGMEQRMFYDAAGEPIAACGGAVDGFGMRRGPGYQNGRGDGDGDGRNGSGSGECDGSGSSTGDCDGSGPHGGGHGSGNGGR